MQVTVVAKVCLLLSGAPYDLDHPPAPADERCSEIIVTDSWIDPTADFIGCAIHGQQNLADWKRHHPLYHSNKWRVIGPKCVAGHYEIKRDL